jgi:hypothetical protein
MGAVDVNLFHFIPTAVLAFGTPSRKFSLLENFTRRALQRITSRPVFKSWRLTGKRFLADGGKVIKT